jgi:HK97 family phage major capsid protein
MDHLSPEALESVRTAVKGVLAENATKGNELLGQAQTQIKEHGVILENTKEAVAAITKSSQEALGRLSDVEKAFAEYKANGINLGARAKSTGQQFAESKEFKDFNETASSTKGSSKKFHVKTITSIAGSAGSGISPQRIPGIMQEPLQPLTIRDLLDTGTTNSNMVEYVRELVFTNNADVVTENTLKPESNITLEDADAPVRTIAHWIRATRQVLADIPQLASLIDGRLRYGLKLKEEQQILLGDGAGQNLLGIVPQATAYNTTYNRAGDTMIDTIRHAMLQVRLAFYPTSGIVMHPTSWHDLELTKDNQNRYMIASPTSRTPPVLWGVPVVEADGLQPGGFLVGAFKLAATIWDREQAAVMVSTEDQDNFVTNRVTILAEERLALTVFRPKSFVYGGFPAGSTT